MKILKPAELQVNDVVCYYRQERGPFCDMRVHRIEGPDIYLRRPYIGVTGDASYEELYWHKNANFQFVLVQR